MLNAQQSALEFEGGLDALRKRPKKELTEEELNRKAELNEERRTRIARLKREQQAAAKEAIRAGKGARAKREERLLEAREQREAKRRPGMEIEPGMVRISRSRTGTRVIWHNDLDLPRELNQSENSNGNGCRLKMVIELEGVPPHRKLESVEDLRAGCPVCIVEKKGSYQVVTRESGQFIGRILPHKWDQSEVASLEEIDGRCFVKTLNRSKRSVSIWVT